MASEARHDSYQRMPPLYDPVSRACVCVLVVAATYETFWGHQLVSLPAYQRFQVACHHVRSESTPTPSPHRLVVLSDGTSESHFQMTYLPYLIQSRPNVWMYLMLMVCLCLVAVGMRRITWTCVWA